ncbi:MAG: SH3 domain-containing protein [Puniceicoccales bacterium]|jgi:tetratricopeptide (TPR) repeat protein|nr:SH3 domain-containing protein [Puniceicoccales bacterium]
MKNLPIYCLLFFQTLSLNALDDRSFFEANEAYGSQDYAKAIELLESAPKHSFARYFNLGCAYQKNNDMGNAWIAFEKAKQIRPYDKNIRYALQTLPLTREQKKFVPPYQTSFAINLLAGLTCFFFWLMVLLWIRRRMKKSIAKGALFLSFAGCLGSGGLLYAASRIFQKCVVVYEGATIHISPTSQSEVVKTLPHGTPLTVAAKHGNFLHIALKKGQNGWIDCKNVKYILD